MRNNNVDSVLGTLLIIVFGASLYAARECDRAVMADAHARSIAVSR
jgi:hypothetical protein